MNEGMATYQKLLRVDVVQGSHRLVLSFLDDVNIKEGDAIVVHATQDGVFTDFSVFHERDDAPID